MSVCTETIYLRSKSVLEACAKFSWIFYHVESHAALHLSILSIISSRYTCAASHACTSSCDTAVSNRVTHRREIIGFILTKLN